MSPRPDRTGKATEDRLVQIVRGLGKKAHIYRIEDAADLHGLNKGQIVITTPKPSDTVVVISGWMSYVECKETEHRNGFPMKNIAQNQLNAARLVTTAGGNYSFFVFSSVRAQTYLVPSTFLLDRRGVVPWEILEPYSWNGTTCPSSAVWTSRPLALRPTAPP